MRIIQIGFLAISPLLRAVVAVPPPLYLYDWELVSGKVNGSDVELIDCITLRHENVAISGTASCNAYSALVDMTFQDWDTSKGTMLVRGLITTEKACGGELDSYAKVYLESLLGLQNFTVNQASTEMSISDKNSVWTFERPPDDTKCPEPPIPYYPMSDYEGEWFASSDATENNLVGCISMRLVGNQISGLAACNGYSGTVNTSETMISRVIGHDEAGVFISGTFSVKELLWSEMDCPEPGLMALEPQYLESLPKLNSFSYWATWDVEAVPSMSLSLGKTMITVGSDSFEEEWQFERTRIGTECLNATLPQTTPTAAPPADDREDDGGDGTSSNMLAVVLLVAVASLTWW